MNKAKSKLALAVVFTAFAAGSAMFMTNTSPTRGGSAEVAVSPGSGVVGGVSGGLAEVALSTLPLQAQQTHQRILAGGPFPYEKDGSVFFNRERLLPSHPRGFYREYTVKTPGASNRGARRIVCGGTRPVAPVACYYTADHYASFQRLRP